MFKRWLHRATRKLELQFGYDASYLHEIVDTSELAALKFGLFQIMSMHRDHVPKSALYAARLAATLSEDCGPCAQLVVNAALQDGIAPQAIAALVRGDLESAGGDCEFGFRYGIAVAQNTDDALELSDDALARYGKRGRVSLAYAVACARVYPALKRGLGHGQACTKIKVETETIILKHAA